MATTYKAIATVTVGSGGAATFAFTSIPATYTDLLVVASLRSDRASNSIDNGWVYFNSDTTSGNYTKRRLWGDGSAVYSATTYDLDYYCPGSTATASTFGNLYYYIPSYAGSNNKSFSVDSSQENNATIAINNFTAGLWSSSSAISSITFDLNNGNFVQYSTATLYGIKNS
jgi:hypothetical protein